MQSGLSLYTLLYTLRPMSICFKILIDEDLRIYLLERMTIWGGASVFSQNAISIKVTALEVLKRLRVLVLV